MKAATSLTFKGGEGNEQEQNTKPAGYNIGGKASGCVVDICDCEVKVPLGRTWPVDLLLRSTSLNAEVFRVRMERATKEAETKGRERRSGSLSKERRFQEHPAFCWLPSVPALAFSLGPWSVLCSAFLYLPRAS